MGFKEWYLAMSIVERVYFYIAAVATVLLIVQILVMLFSFGGGGDVGEVGDFDGDISADVSDGGFDGDNGLSIFTIKSLTAFFCIGGWVGLALFAAMPNVKWVGILVSLLVGGAAMFLVAYALKKMQQLQCSGNLVESKLVGKQANVYVKILPQRSGVGKITLNAQGRYLEFDAVTDEEKEFSYGEKVVIDAMENDVAIVKSA